MKKRDIPGIGEILNDLKKSSPLGKQLEQAAIWEHWPEIAGKTLAAHAQPIAIKKQTLTIEVDSPAWMHRASYAKWDLVKHINRLARKELISDIFLVLKDS
ncbi:MAG: DUF721 domain-containing protein [Candidatus Hydrogenedentes bacterium]|nr:DUF721 domain-containing protein [Candidatus Hydrogenedentota bacterium]